MHLTMNSSGVNPNFLLGLYLVTMIGLSLSWFSLFSLNSGNTSFVQYLSFIASDTLNLSFYIVMAE